MKTIKIFLFRATNLDWDQQQLNVNNAFLPEKKRMVYMEIPPGFINEHSLGKAC